MQIETYSFTPTELQNAANVVKESVLTALERDGVIADSTALCERYAVVLVSRGWFGRVLDKVFGVEQGAVQFRLVRVLDAVRRSDESAAPPVTEE